MAKLKRRVLTSNTMAKRLVDAGISEQRAQRIAEQVGAKMRCKRCVAKNE